LIKSDWLGLEGKLPLVVRPATDGVDLVAIAPSLRAFFIEKLVLCGAILLRGFNLLTPESFEQFIASVSGDLMSYRERSSPRTAIFDRVYTSTEYPANLTIFPHNENSYAHTWPAKIFFFCVEAPAAGGETPLVDCTRVYRRIGEGTRERFTLKNVLYVRNFGRGVRMDWRTVFQADDRKTVEECCREAGYEVEWMPGDRLRTRRVGCAVVNHPVTGEPVWFNHAAFFHVSTLDPAIRDALRSQYHKDDLPNNTYYGDGGEIEPETLDEIRDAYWNEAVVFPWRCGDVLMVDNMRVAHGRNPFSGPRKVLVGMSEPVVASSLKS
jgi:alpha-ketoglutarate-dependent taurine dioxygenase